MSKQSDKQLKELKTKGDKEHKKIMPWYQQHADRLFEVHCLQHGGIIAIEAVMADEKVRTHADGAVVVVLGDQLLSYRRRTDGTMGYTCQCGASTILLDEEAALKTSRALYPHIKAEIDEKIRKRKAGPKPTEIFKRVKVK